MAYVPKPTSSFYVMEMVSIIVMALLIGVAIYMVRKQLRRYKQTKKGLSSVLIWIGFAFVAFSLLLNTGAGSFISLFLNEYLNLGYFLPLTLSFDFFLVSAGFMLSAGLVALLTYESQKGKRRQTIAERKAAEAAAADKPMGIEVFADHNQN